MAAKKNTRSRGRPRAYDRDAALDAAVDLFWARGYEATSLDDLGAAMGMGRPSIYNAFGNKEELFLEALRRYQTQVAFGPLRALEAEEGLPEAIQAFLDGVVDYTTADERHRGCLIGSVAIASDLDSVRALIRDLLDDLETTLTERFAAAVAEGRLPKGYPVARAVNGLIDEMLSLMVRARIGVARERLASDAQATGRALLEMA